MFKSIRKAIARVIGGKEYNHAHRPSIVDTPAPVQLPNRAELYSRLLGTMENRSRELLKAFFDAVDEYAWVDDENEAALRSAAKTLGLDVDCLDSDELQAFCALLEAGDMDATTLLQLSPAVIISGISYALDTIARGDYAFNANIYSDSTLVDAIVSAECGEVSELIWEYLDIERFSADWCADHGGYFTRWGYVQTEYSSCIFDR